jgi:hypothetical protein
MDRARSNHSSKTEALPTDDRLDSWKEIAAYLKRSVRTLHRWEKEEGLPVHRQLHKELGSAFAYKSELDAWSSARSARAEFQKEADEKATTLAWSADDSRLFFLTHTSARVVGELTSVSIHGGPEKAHGPVGPFQRDFQMAMDVSPRDEIVFAACRESAHELWVAKLK